VWCLPSPGAIADHSLDLGLHDDVGEPLDAVGLNASMLQDSLQLLARELRAVAQRPDDGVPASAKHGRLELQPAVVWRHAAG
jgi:hypothetical protein